MKTDLGNWIVVRLCWRTVMINVGHDVGMLLEIFIKAQSSRKVDRAGKIDYFTTTLLICDLAGDRVNTLLISEFIYLQKSFLQFRIFNNFFKSKDVIIERLILEIHLSSSLMSMALTEWALTWWSRLHCLSFHLGLPWRKCQVEQGFINKSLVQ